MVTGPAETPSSTLPTWKQLLSEAESALGSTVDARRIVARAGGFTWAELTLVESETASGRASAWIQAMVERRRQGEPLQYVLGVWGFRNLELLVDRRVLIPRPETETVVDIALGELRRGAVGVGSNHPLVVDLGTGSGAIALAIASEMANTRVWATDVSADALAMARANLAGTGSAVAPRVTMCEGSWFQPLPPQLAGHVDLIVANPPYVGADEALPAEVGDWEPSQALVAGPLGLEAVNEIVGQASDWLIPGGSLVVEIAPHQAGDASAAAMAAGLVAVHVHPDLVGRPRALVARRARPSG